MNVLRVLSNPYPHVARVYLLGLKHLQQGKELFTSCQNRFSAGGYTRTGFLKNVHRNSEVKNTQNSLLSQETAAAPEFPHKRG